MKHTGLDLSCHMSACELATANLLLLCVTGLEIAKLSGGHHPGAALICFHLARANLVLLHGRHAVVVIDWRVIGCPLSRFLCHIFEGYGGTYALSMCPSADPEMSGHAVISVSPPPDCYRSLLARRGHPNC